MMDDREFSNSVSPNLAVVRQRRGERAGVCPDHLGGPAQPYRALLLASAAALLFGIAWAADAAALALWGL